MNGAELSFFQLLSFPFFQRAIIAGLIVSALSGVLGIFVVLRKGSFFGDTIAHSSLAGVAIGLLLGIHPLITAAIFASLLAISLPILERKSRLPTDNVLGFLLPFSIGIAVILLSLMPGYQPELVSYLFGSILSIDWQTIGLISIFGLVAVSILVRFRKILLAVVFDETYARMQGIPTLAIQTLLNVILAITIILSIKVVGIVLVNALLIIPALIARSHAKAFWQLFVLTPLIGVSCTLIGLVVSVFFNIPTGPTIAVISGCIFLANTVVVKK